MVPPSAQLTLAQDPVLHDTGEMAVADGIQFPNQIS